MTTEKPKVSLEIKLPNGAVVLRSTSGDFATLPQRIYWRLSASIDSKFLWQKLVSGINCYEYGNYGEALVGLRAVSDVAPAVAKEIAPHIRICERVLQISVPSADLRAHASARRSYAAAGLLGYKRILKPGKLRCKYCGRYVSHHHPYEGLAYFGSNNCRYCDRGYPNPDFVWDGIDGQAYIYYRHSVTEEAFYHEFNEMYEVDCERRSNSAAGAGPIVRHPAQV